MHDLTVPPTFATQLEGIPHPIHLCDATGKKLGYFLPLAAPMCDNLEPGLTTEELQQIEQSSEWSSTEQILDRLEKLK